MNIFAFGDIHGEFLKLKHLVDRIHISKEDTLVFLGDYIDRGKMTFEVIDYLIELSKKHICVFIYGNHESMFMDFMSGINEDLFYANGGKKTIESYAKHGYDIRKNVYYLNRKMPKEHIKFFQQLKKYYETEDFIFVHAGIFPGISLEESSEDILLWTRQFSSIPYEGKPVIYGHCPNSTILNEEYKICIDTGACFESMGDLTCVQLPERHFYRQGYIKEDTIVGEMVTNLQLKKMAKIFRKSGKTFQKLATEAGFVLLPDHASELTKEDARVFLKHFSAYLVEPREKQ